MLEGLRYGVYGITTGFVSGIFDVVSAVNIQIYADTSHKNVSYDSFHSGEYLQRRCRNSPLLC